MYTLKSPLLTPVTDKNWLSESDTFNAVGETTLYFFLSGKLCTEAIVTWRLYLFIKLFISGEQVLLKFPDDHSLA